MNLITRSDFDGLVCATMLKEVELIEEINFAHPRDIQDQATEVGPADILANLPYHPKCGMWFDHHSSEQARTDIPAKFEGRVEVAPSCARVIANHYKSARFKKFEELLVNVDKVDSANLTIDEVKDAKGWILLGMIMDPRTGLGKFHDYIISNRQLMFHMIALMATHSADDILRMKDVRERIDRYHQQQAEFVKVLKAKGKQDGNVIVFDTRGIKDLPSGNRFLMYTEFPSANISMQIMDGKGGQNVAVAIGHSIFNKSSKTDVGKLCVSYGSGGHRAAGTVQLDLGEANRQVGEILERLKKDG